MNTPALTHRTAMILIFSMLLLAFGGSLVAQSGTQDQVGTRAPRIFAAQTGTDQVTLVWDKVPGTTEYRIYLPDPNNPGPPAPGSRPTMSLSGSSQRAIILGVGRIAAGAYLEAVGQGEVLYRGTFNAVARAPLAPATAPAAVQARETGKAEVTLSWSPVPGATAYMILRTVRGTGWQMLCDICPPSGEFMDTTAVPGIEHTYMVAAIFPEGISTRTPSNTLTVGAAQLAAATASASTAAVWSKPMSTGTPVAGTAADNTNVGASADTPTTGTTTPTGITTTTPTAGATTTGTGTATPSTGSTSNPCTPVVAPKTGASTIYTKMMATATPVAGTAADDTNVGASAGTPTTGSTGGCPTGSGTSTPIGTRTPGGASTGMPSGSIGSADYQKGKSLNPGAMGYPDLWDPVATASGMTSAERIAAWKEIGIVALEYKHILGRQPTPDETRRDVAALKGCTTWKQLWRQLAHSAERDTHFGYWAAAPLADPLQAQKDFGLAVPPWTSQQCFGGLGPKCNGGVPEWPNDRVGPVWSGAFYMPDNTRLAYVEIGVAVGSILHDNACLKDKNGLNCNGYDLLGDAVKSGLVPAALEWNKAAWNVLDLRTWRQTFGPYPTDQLLREFDWYDDLRPATARSARMAPVLSVLTVPELTVNPTVGETSQTRALQAPAGTSLDISDSAFCRSAGGFGSTGWFVGKASWGICK